MRKYIRVASQFQQLLEKGTELKWNQTILQQDKAVLGLGLSHELTLRM